MLLRPGRVGRVGAAARRGGSLLSRATSQLGGIAPYHYWDFLNNRALFASADVGAVSATPGWSFTRASTGYAETVAGTLTSFASGALRRTDRGVLIEGARTNLALRSAEFDNAAWAAVGTATVTANQIAAPDGTLTADLLLESAITDNHFLRTSAALTVSSATVYTFSVYAKVYGTRTFISLMDDGARRTWFNLGTGAVGTTNAGHTAGIQALANGWYRVWITFTTAGTSTVPYILVNSANNQSTYAGSTSEGLYIWGAQVEAASFPSSYIPTTTASVTRAADVLTVSSPGVSYPLTLFAEFERVVDTGAVEYLVQVDAGDSNNRAHLIVQSNDFTSINVTTGGAGQGTVATTAPVLGATTKSAAAVTTNRMQIATNAGLGTEDTVVTVPSAPTNIRIGSNASGTEQPFGYIRRAAIFNSSLSNANLQTVTT